MDAWKKHVRGLWEQLTELKWVFMRESILEGLGEIAETAGDFLGVQSIFPTRESVLEDLERILR